MSGDTTSGSVESISGESREGERALGLALCWSLHEPARVGEVALLRKAGLALTFGRGNEADSVGRVCFFRHRPGGLEPREPFVAPAVSRDQLSLRLERGALRVENLGRCEFFLNDERVDRGVVRPGDVLFLKNQLSFLCVERSVSLPASKAPLDGREGFAAPDAIGWVGESEAAWRLRHQVVTLVHAMGHVLIHGGVGTGKEVVARGVHALSSRSGGEFVARHALTVQTLADLCGRNDADGEREGLVDLAESGALMIDEIGELAPELQAALVRLLSSGEYQRVGDSRTRRADVRLLCTTSGGASPRTELLARLPLQINVPGLDQRREDIPVLIRLLLGRIAEQVPEIGERFADDHGEFRIEPQLVHALLRHRWELHVRELDSLLWTAIAESTEDFLALTQGVREQLGLGVSAQPAHAEPSKEQIETALDRHAGNQSRASQDLRLTNRFALIRLMKKHGISSKR